MAKPTKTAWRWLQRTIGYLKRMPVVGILLRPARPDACFGYGGKASNLGPGSRVTVESITDGQETRGREQQDRYTLQAEWWQAMCAMRTERSIALSSGESEFIALVGGSSKALYIGDCLRFLVQNTGLEINILGRLPGNHTTCGMWPHLPSRHTPSLGADGSESEAAVGRHHRRPDKPFRHRNQTSECGTAT